MVTQTCKPVVAAAGACRPKPNHYLQWLRTGKCEFNDMCKIVSALGVAVASGQLMPCPAPCMSDPAVHPSPAWPHELAISHPAHACPACPLPFARAWLFQGIDNGFCKYASEYRLYAPDWNVTHTLHRLCGNLKAGIWHM